LWSEDEYLKYMYSVTLNQVFMKNLGESGVGDGDILSRNRMKD
jgi:hypothetical protein